MDNLTTIRQQLSDLDTQIRTLEGQAPILTQEQHAIVSRGREYIRYGQSRLGAIRTALVRQQTEASRKALSPAGVAAAIARRDGQAPSSRYRQQVVGGAVLPSRMYI